jgi:phenylalanyl-tRNA synthetase beta chain
MLEGQAIGWLGKLHPGWQQHYQLPRNTLLFELDVAALLERTLAHYQEVPKFPPVRRDLAVIVDEKVPVQALLDTMLDAKIPQVSEVALFDVYRGKGIAENKKSLAFLVLMQDTQKTLTDQEADAAMAKLLDLMMRQHGAELRT